MKYREDKSISKTYKDNYVQGLNHIIEQRQKHSESIRSEYTKDIFSNPEKYREDLKQMLGWPLVEHENASLPGVVYEKLSDEGDYCIYRMQFEILEGLKMTGLYFELSSSEKRPLVIVQHGGYGTPEHISGFEGDTTNYNDMLHRVRKHGVDVFAPQLLLWHDDYDVDYDRKEIDARLKRVGSSITAVEVYGITRILDYFESQKNISVFGMVGLSYGGFYTLYTSAVDTRLKAAISCSFFNKRDAVAWPDWTWHKSAELFDDAEVACLVYPRKLYIEFGNQDKLFDFTYGMESFDKLTKMCKNVGTDWLSLTVFDGVHEFCMDDAPIEKLIADLKQVKIGEK